MDASIARPFCGREAELDALRRAYARLEGAESAPQLVVLLGESGLGKTRLVQQFYNWLSQHRDGAGEAGYWPDVLSPSDAYRDINPSAPCNGAVAPPFLWLGLPCNDRIEGLDGYAARLAPHLEPLIRARTRRDWAVGVAKGGGKLAIDMVPVVGPLLTSAWGYAKDARKAFDAWFGKRARVSSADSFAVAQARVQQEAEARLIASFADFLDEADGVLDAARVRELDRKAAGLKRIPAVLVVDDAQWAARSPAILSFVRALLDKAAERRWPLMVIATHWQAEWNAALKSDAPSFARIASGWATARDPAWTPLLVKPQTAGVYDRIVAEALPGLTADQRALVLERAGGNPRLLEEIILHARINERWFEGRSAANALTPEGAEALSKARLDLHDLVARRLAAAAPEVRKAIGLSALQGMEFLAAITAAVAEELGTGAAANALEAGEDPHALIYRLEDGVFAFAQNVYRDVARADVENFADGAAVRSMLRAAVRARLADAAALKALDARQRQVVLRIGAAALEDSEQGDDRAMRAGALLQLANAAAAELDYVTMISFVDEALAGDGVLDQPAARHGVADISMLVKGLLQFGRAALARRLVSEVWCGLKAGPDEVSLAEMAAVDMSSNTVAKADGLGPVMSGAQDDAIRNERLGELINTDNPEVLERLAVMRAFETEIDAAMAAGDVQRELDARHAKLMHWLPQMQHAAEAMGPANRSLMIAQANVSRREFAALSWARRRAGALDKADGARWTLETEAAVSRALLDEMVSSSHEAMAADNSVTSREMATRTICDAGQIYAERGWADELDAAMAGIRPVVLALAAETRSPSVLDTAFEALIHLAAVRTARGRFRDAYDEFDGALKLLAARAKLLDRPEDDPRKAAILGRMAKLAPQAGMATQQMLTIRALEALRTSNLKDCDPELVLSITEPGFAFGVSLMETGSAAAALEVFAKLRDAIAHAAPHLPPDHGPRGVRNTSLKIGECAMALDDQDGAFGAMTAALPAAETLFALTGDEADRAALDAIRSAVAGWHVVLARTRAEAGDLAGAAEAIAVAETVMQRAGADGFEEERQEIAAIRAEFGDRL